jgi:parallel beta-helix repeat protein
MQLESLEDRIVPTMLNIFADASYTGINGPSDGTITKPWTTIQDALIEARNNPGPDNVYVYGNNTSQAYVWTHDGDANNDGIPDGNMYIGDPNDPTNTVQMYFRATEINPASPSGDGSGGDPAQLVVKLRDNLIDVLGGSRLRVEGTNTAARVVFTSYFDDTVDGDTDGDGNINSPARANWGGIRFRADAVDQGGLNAQGQDDGTGSFINYADIRYSGETLFDEVAGFNAEFAAVRMEANATNPANVHSAQVRVWNTVFEHNGRALDVNINALGRGGKASSVVTGPDLGAADVHPLTFVDNSINGAFIFIPADPFTGFLQQLDVNSTLDDVGVPYVITDRLVIANPQTTPGLPNQVTLTFDAGTVFKAQNTGLDGIDFGQPNDRTFGTIVVNGTANRPVLFTSLTDDALVPGTDLPTLYNNGSADTNDDGNATTPQPGDWGGIRIAQGNIDHAFVRYGGGQVQTNGTFTNWPAIRVFARDLTPYGQNVQHVRISNSDISQTFSDLTGLPTVPPSGIIDSPAIDLFSRDDGDTRYDFGNTPLRRTGDVQIMDNNIHDNQGRAIEAHPLYFNDARNSDGGYGVYFGRNILTNNAINGVYIKFILNLNTQTNQNLPSAGAVFDDSDIVHVIDGQALIVHPDQYFAMMSQRGVLPDPNTGGYLQRFSDQGQFIAGLVMRLPGNLPTNTTLPMNLPLQQGPLGIDPQLVDSGLFYYLTNFNSTARGASSVNAPLTGNEWQDWGAQFVYNGANSNLVNPGSSDPAAANGGQALPFITVADPNNPTGQIFQTNMLNGDGSMDIVFPDQVSAVGFYINNNQSTAPDEKIQLFDKNGSLIESDPLPVTAAGGRTYFARISRTPIYKVRITQDANKNTAASSIFSAAGNVAIPDGTSFADLNIPVNQSFSFSDLKVNVNITHGQASDLILDLISPSGQVIHLANRTGGAGAAGANYTNTYFDDSAVTPIAAGLAPFTGAFYPVSFDPFNPNTSPGLGALVTPGNNAQGTWKLRVYDAAANGIAGSITNASLTFRRIGGPLNTLGISGLVWVAAPASLVVKAATADTVITAANVQSPLGVQNGFTGITQNAAGVITNGFVPDMYNTTISTNTPGMFTFGQSTQSQFSNNTQTTIQGGNTETVVPITVGNDFVPYDMAVRLNVQFGSNTGAISVYLRAPDGTQIPLAINSTNGFTNSTFDDQAPLSLSELPNPTNQSVQSYSFSNTRRTTPTQATPYGLTFWRKDVKGTWAIVIDNSSNTTGTFNGATLIFRGINSGWGTTLRIMGQGNAPVVLTTIEDDSAGAGPVGHVAFDTSNDGPTVATPGSWHGIQLLQGINSDQSYVVTQNANGTLNTRYASLNPYVRGDIGLIYPGINNPNGVLLSTQDATYTLLSGLNGGTTAATKAPFPGTNAANMQDGTLIEYADIRDAQTGIDERVYPKNKLTIDGNLWEPSTAEPGLPNQHDPTLPTTVIQPVPELGTNQYGQLRFLTTDGTYTVSGQVGLSGEQPLGVTNDVNWYQLPNPAVTTEMYINLQGGRDVNGVDEPNGAAPRFNIGVYDVNFRLLYWSGASGPGVPFPVYPNFPGQQNSGNSLGPILLQPGDFPFTGPNYVVDAKYIAIMPRDMVPRSFVDAAAVDGQGSANFVYTQLPVNTFSNSPFQASPPGADGGQYVMFPQNSNLPNNPTSDWPWFPPGTTWDGTWEGGYEMTLKMTTGGIGSQVNTLGSQATAERQIIPPRIQDGQILIRSNTISDSSGPAISLSDSRTTPTIPTLGATIPLQAARFPFNALNLATNSTGNVYRNEDVNTINPQFSAPANFVPGPTIQNNLIIRNQGDGIVLHEDRNSNNVTGQALGVPNPVPYSSNTITPTAFTQIFNNTIDSNGGTGINLFTRGGPTVENNIVSNNGAGLSITDGYDILTNTPPVLPVVSYNIFYNNPISGNPFTGANNIIGSTAAQDPQFVDPNSNDYRIKVGSPAVDSAISDLQDRLRSVRFPQVPTRAPNLDLRGYPRVDNPFRPNVGAGQFPFYDRGALENNEFSLRVIGLSILTDDDILGQPLTSITITFSGRVDPTTFTTSSVALHQGSATGPVVPYLAQLTSHTYDANSNTDTWTITFQPPISDGTYVLVLDGQTAAALKDISGQLLDGEFPVPYQLPSGNGAPGGSFIYPFAVRTSKVAGTVWLNTNGNSTIDAGEPPLPGVTVDLFDSTGTTLIATTTTNAQGQYLFNNLASGAYEVEVDNSTLPAPDYTLNTPPAIRTVNLPIGGVSGGNNFGYWIDDHTATIAGNVFNDLNGNGTIDPGEGPVTNNGNPVNFTMTLTAEENIGGLTAGQTFQVISDNTGHFSFGNLPGNVYQLTIDESNLPPGYIRTSPLTLPINLGIVTPGSNVTQNIGYQQNQAQIAGIVFSDDNGDGTQDNGEGGIANVGVTLTRLGQFGGTFTTTTDGNGNYFFNNLTAGTYRVDINSGSPVLANYFLTTGNASQTLTLNQGIGTFPAQPVGYRLDPRTGSIAGAMFVDPDMDGFPQPGDTPFPNQQISIRWAGRDGIFGTPDDQLFTATTNAAGAFDTGSAPGTLPVGLYQVQPVSEPAGFSRFTPPTLPFLVTLGYAQRVQNVNFAYVAANSAISGTVWNDLNGDGVLQGTETGRFANARVFIDTNNDGQYEFGEPVTFTNASGAYSFNGLAAGTYKVMVDTGNGGNIPSGFVPTIPFQLVTVNGSNNQTGENLGLQQRNATFQGRVWLDTNNNGIFDPNEVGAVGQTVTLTFTGSPVPVNFQNPQQVTISATNGLFTFSGLPAGTYSVQTTTPTGGTVATPPGNPQSITLAAGQVQGVVRNFPIQFAGAQGAGVWYMTFAGNQTTLTNSDGSQTVVNNTDIVRLAAPSAGVWRYDVFFHGDDVGLLHGTSEAIDAFTFTNTGDIILSTLGTYSVNNGGAAITGFGEDLLKFHPTHVTTVDGFTAGTWSLFFKGSRVGLSGAAGNVDAVSLTYATPNAALPNKILLSIAGTKILGGFSVNPQDVVAFTPTSFGATTAGTYNRMFVGSTFGLNDPTAENVDALFFMPNSAVPSRPTLFISTHGNFLVPGFTGAANDMLKFSATSGGPTGLLAGSFNAVALRGANFGQASNTNIDGFWMGTVATDPNPFSTTTGNGAGASAFAGMLGRTAAFTTGPTSSGNDFVALPSSTPRTAGLASTLAASTARTTGSVRSAADHFFSSSAKKAKTARALSLARSLVSQQLATLG